MLSEYSRRVNTSAAFAQQDRGLQFLLGKRVFFTTDLSLVSCRHKSALVARCADFSLASHMPCWSSCHERVILVVALRDVANGDVFYVFYYNSEAPCTSGTPVLVSGDTVRVQFCEEDARASSSDVSISLMNSQGLHHDGDGPTATEARFQVYTTDGSSLDFRRGRGGDGFRTLRQRTPWVTFRRA